MTESPDAYIHRSVVKVLKIILGDDWDQDLVLNPDTSLIYDIGLESLEFVHLASLLHDEFPRLDLARRLVNYADGDFTIGQLTKIVRACTGDEVAS